MSVKRIAFLLTLGSAVAAVAASQAVATHPHPQNATPTRVSLVPAYRQCTAPNTTHGAPLTLPSCKPPVQASKYLTVGTPDANGNAAQSTGYAEFRVFYCPMCESIFNEEVFISVELTDVRNRSDLSDYIGELQVNVTLRISDHYNKSSTGSLTAPGTVQDYTFRFAVPCTATDDATVGSTCTVSTTADAITPGIIQLDKAAIWELGKVRIFDGGADGKAASADNTLFAVQGIFLP